MKKKVHSGFTLIEVMVGVAVFVLFFVGIYSMITFVFKIVYQSRLRILETGILNEQVEIVRNLPFEKVGIVNGSPSGVLEHTITTTRDGIDFTITRTIRNIDDPFDGTIGGDPNDTAPADYKMVDIEIICDHCGQRESLSLTTQVGPKFLEGDPSHGALFIEVFDAQAAPVQGATVHIVAPTAVPAIDIIDTTDNNGMLRIVDLGAGLNSYNITVSKNGYTTDQTVQPSEANPNPVKPPATVVAKDVSEISFSIDRVSSINLSTINKTCQPIGSVPVRLTGAKLLGTEPDVLKVDQNTTTNGSGERLFSNLEWDAYGLRATGYDLLGSIPVLPVSLLPGVDQPVQLVLGANTVNSLVISVVDSMSQQPLSNATVQVTATGYDETKTTGVGFVRQTDWSGGSGQLLLENETKYFSDDGKMEINSPSGDIKLREVGESYVASAEMESSIFDLGVASNFVNLIWEPLAQPAETGDDSARFQLATSDTTTTPTWDYFGPDGTVGTFYDAQNVNINSIHNGDQYLRYKLFLSTASTTFTPVVSDWLINYITSCTPPGQAYFGGLSELEYTVKVNRTGYQEKTQTIGVSGDMIFSVEMSAI